MSSSPPFDTQQLQAWLARMRAGDGTAREELLRSVSARLQGLARRMLRQFPAVRPWEQTDDVLQNAVLRLLRALQAVDPISTRAFFDLAAMQIRRELLDLARRYSPRRRGTAANPETLPAPHNTGPEARGEPAAPDAGPHLERWAAFHEAVEQLPGREREVVGLTFYHGWTQRQVAELFGVTERTVRRWWHTACVGLQEALGDEFPEW